MSDRGGRRGGAGAPFYAPPRRKTSAEIISEARAAIYGEISGSSSGGEGYGGGGGLRPLRTRRPYTPRDPQRTLFADRDRRKEARPPSAFNLKYLSEEAAILATGTKVGSLDEAHVKGVLLTEPQSHSAKKKVAVRPAPRVSASSNDWSGLTKLPHLNGRSKPLHRRNTTNGVDDSKSDSLHELAHAILVTQPLGAEGDTSISSGSGSDYHYHTSVPDTSMKRKLFGSEKAHTIESQSATDKVRSAEIGIKHLSVHLNSSKNTAGKFDDMGILELAEALSHKSRDTERTLQLMEALYRVVQEKQPSSTLRDFTLRTLYLYIDSEDVVMLVAIARVMLTMRVTGTHLAAACKIVFKVARNDSNDHFFRTTNLLELLVEGCGRADPVTEGECCVYGAGALRFLALEPRLRRAALAAGALHLAALHLKILNNAKAENPRHSTEHSSHALYQLTGALRNLAGAGAGAGAEAGEGAPFVTSGALAELLTALQLHHTDRDVLTNVVRCLSVLSGEYCCCLWLCASPHSAPALLSALCACAARAALAVRLAYTLGNMAAAEEHARINIYGEERGVDVLLLILEAYTKRNERDVRDPDADPDLHLIGSDLGGSDGSNEDVLIKTVRVIANLCLARRVGRGLAERHAGRLVLALLSCLELAQREPADTTAVTDLEEDGAISGEERRLELATAALATLNNVTFYREPPPPPDPLAPLLERLCRVTCRWLSGKGPAACEAVRALGNLSRCPQTAKFIVLEGALDALAPFLQHEASSVRCAAAGVLVNVCGAGAVGGAEASRVACLALSAAASERDAATAALLTRALWNAQAHQPLSPADAARATSALDQFIDDESVFAACEAKLTDRRASDPELSKQHVKFIIESQNDGTKKPFIRSYSVDQELHLECTDEDPDRCCEDLGFEEGDQGECGCECDPCRRLAAWEELVAVAIPLLELLRPVKTDASVGTD